MQRWPWLRDRSAAQSISLERYEFYTVHALAVIARLGVKTLGDLSRISEDELLAVTEAVGCSCAEVREIFSMFGEYLAREGLSFRREPPIVVIDGAERPLRTAPRAGLSEHLGDGYRCFLPEQPPRPEHWPAPGKWSWEMRGYLVSFYVLPLDEAHVDTLVLPQHAGTMESGPWGALVECERIPRYAAHAGHAHEVTLFDAALGLRAVATVQAWSPETRAPEAATPDDLVALTAELACSLVGR